MNENLRIIRLLEQAESEERCAWSAHNRDYHPLMRRVQTGMLHMPTPGLFIRSALWNRLSYHERIMHILKAVCSRHPDWILCGPSAAAALGFTSSMHLQRYVHIVARERSRSGRHGYVVEHYLDCDEYQGMNGIQTTTPLRTLFDCARMLDFENAMAVCSMGLRKIDGRNDDLYRYCDDRHRRWGVGRALYVAENAEPRCENGEKATAVAVIIALRYRRPKCQVAFESPLDGKEIRPDFLWERDDGVLIAGELDGRQKYLNSEMTGGRSSLDVTLSEKDRETELNMLNMRVVRFQMSHVKDGNALRQRLEGVGVPHSTAPVLTPFSNFRCTLY